MAQNGLNWNGRRAMGVRWHKYRLGVTWDRGIERFLGGSSVKVFPVPLPSGGVEGGRISS